MARVAPLLLGIATLITGCWRDPDAVAARFAVAATDAVTLADVATTTCPEGTDCSDDAPCLVAPKCQGGKCAGPERYWTRTVQVTSERDEIDAVWPTADGGLVAVGSADVSNVPYGLARHLFALHVGPAGLSATGQAPQPLWLKQDAAHDHVLTGIVPLGGTRYLGVGRHVEIPGPLGLAPRSWAWWMRFDADGGPEFDGKLEVDGGHAWNAIAQAPSGASLAVGVLDQSALVTRFTPAGDKGWSRTLLPMDKTRGRLQAVTATAAESWAAAGYWVADDGNAAGGWAVGLAGPGTDVAWNQTYAAPQPGNGAFYWLGATGVDEVVAVGAVWQKDGNGKGAEFPPDSAAKAWFVRIRRADGQRIAERTWQWPGNPGAFTVLNANRLAIWQHGAVASATGDLMWLDTFGNSVGQAQLPRHAVTQLTGAADGAVFLTGVSYTGLGDAYLARVSPWGAPTCQNVGTCAAQTLSSCDDDAPCTVDVCDAVFGCIHAPLPDSSPCMGGICHSGACSP